MQDNAPELASATDLAAAVFIEFSENLSGFKAAAAQARAAADAGDAATAQRYADQAAALRAAAMQALEVVESALEV